MTAVERLARQRIVPVLRCRDVGDARRTAEAAAAAGLTFVELTYTTPGVLDAVAPLIADGLTVAIGTVLSADQVRQAADAGAAMVVSFTLPVRFLETAAEVGVTAIPGALTPTEIAAAHTAGARVVKLFPARLAQESMLADMRAVVPSVRLLPTGGIGPGDARRWLDAGAIAVGLGSSLGTTAAVGAEEVTRRCLEARRFVTAGTG